MEAVYGSSAFYWASDKIVIRDFLSQWVKKFPNISGTASATDSLEAIGEVMQANLTEEQLDYVAEVCSIQQLSTDNELQSMNVKQLKSKPHLFDKVEPDPASELMTQQELVKKKEVKPLQNLKYRGNIWNIKENSSKVDLKPGEEVLLAVRIFQPFPHRNSGPNNAQPRCTQEIYVLGQQNLCALRDIITCVNDGILAKECSEDPYNRPKVLAKDVYKSGFFFINDTFFNDFRCPQNIDYSEVIQKWALDHGIRQCQSKLMEQTKFIDLSLRLGYPYVYQHQGSCEHLLVFSDIRLLSARDSLSSEDYPLIHSSKASKTRYCMVCGIYSAKWITCNNERVPHDPAYFCDTCFKSFNYIDGKKVGSFKAYPYVHIASLTI